MGGRDARRGPAVVHDHRHRYRRLVEVRQRKPENVKVCTAPKCRYAVRIRMELWRIVRQKIAAGFSEAAVDPAARGVYRRLGCASMLRFPIAAIFLRGGGGTFRFSFYPLFLPPAFFRSPLLQSSVIHLKSWLQVPPLLQPPSPLQAYLTDFPFRFNSAFFIPRPVSMRPGH